MPRHLAIILESYRRGDHLNDGDFG